MAKDPAFLFYSQDFIVGVQTMTFEDRGKYITLLALMHQQGRMKEETIRFLIGSISDNLKSKFQIDRNDHWYNKRLEEEVEKRKKFTESRRNNGRKGGRPKESNNIKEKKSKNHMANHMEDENEIENVDRNEIDNKVEIISIEKIEFEKVRKLYPGTKRGLDTEFANFIKHQDWKAVLSILFGSLEYQIEQKNKSTGFVPEWAHFQTWINQRKWEEEIKIKPTNKQNNNGLNNLEKETLGRIYNL